jgi:hypothetical protein
MDPDATLGLDLDHGVSLPASWYTDPALAERERARIFRRTWQYVGRSEQVARAARPRLTPSRRPDLDRAGRLPVAGRGSMPAPMTRLQQVILGLLAAAVVAGTVAFGVLRLYTAS